MNGILLHGLQWNIHIVAHYCQILAVLDKIWKHTSNFITLAFLFGYFSFSFQDHLNKVSTVLVEKKLNCRVLKKGPTYVDVWLGVPKTVPRFAQIFIYY